MPATFVVTTEPGNLPPRNRLDVTLPGGSTAGSVLITRTDPDGRTRVVRLADPASITGTAWVGYDYEAPFGASVMYSAVAQYMNPGFFMDTLADTVTLAVADVWLIHPGIPALSMMLPKVKSLGDRSRPVSRGIFAPYGRAEPIVVTDGKRKAVQATLVIRTRTLDELGALVALTADAAVLLLNVPESLGWGVSYEYISLGDLMEARETETGDDPYRLISGPYHVVSRPVGGSQSQRTYADVLAESATYTVVLADFTDYIDLLAPTT